MGFSHYWYKKEKLDKATFKAFSKDCRKVLENSSIALCYTTKKNGEWLDVEGFEANSDIVNFNGVRDDGMETFWFERDTPISNVTRDDKVFNSCKTNEKPYDAEIVACLILAKIHFKSDINLNSDGDLNDWELGMSLVEKHCGYSITLAFPKDVNGHIDVLVDIPKVVIEPLENPEIKKRLDEEFKNSDIYELMG